MSYPNLSALLEAIVYLAEEPVTLDAIHKALPDVERSDLQQKLDCRRAYRLWTRFSAKKRAPAHNARWDPPRYATRGNLPVSRRDREKGITPSMEGLCLRHG